MRCCYFVQDIFGAKPMQFLFEKFAEEVYDRIAAATGRPPLIGLRIGGRIRVAGILCGRGIRIRRMLGILRISRIIIGRCGLIPRIPWITRMGRIPRIGRITGSRVARLWIGVSPGTLRRGVGVVGGDVRLWTLRLRIRGGRRFLFLVINLIAMARAYIIRIITIILHNILVLSEHPEKELSLFVGVKGGGHYAVGSGR